MVGDNAIVHLYHYFENLKWPPVKLDWQISDEKTEFGILKNGILSQCVQRFETHGMGSQLGLDPHFRFDPSEREATDLYDTRAWFLSSSVASSSNLTPSACTKEEQVFGFYRRFAHRQLPQTAQEAFSIGQYWLFDNNLIICQYRWQFFLHYGQISGFYW